MNKAFTIIELIVTVAIIAIFSGMGLARYVEFTEQDKLKQQTRQLMSVVELAKKKATSADLYDTNCTNFQGYRVELAATSYSLIFLCNGIQQEVQNYSIADNMQIFSGAGNLDFNPLGIGTKITVGTVTVKSDRLNKCINIDINSSGIMSTTETLISC